MQRTRQTAVAGTFYPADPVQLREQVDGFLAATSAAAGDAVAAEASVETPRAIIAPHAGYPYSGPTAADAFATLRGAQGIRRVVVIGPSHHVSFRGIALPDADAYRTPLGDLPLDADGVESLAEFAYVGNAAEAHRQEHSIEVELPFLQRLLGDVPVIPLVTGAAAPEQVGDALDRLWDDGTLLVVSSDLSHFLDYEAARLRDAATANTITAGAPDDLDDGDACGRLAIQGLMIVAARRGMHISLLDLRNSGDTAGPRDRVVGYGAFRVDSVGGGHEAD